MQQPSQQPSIAPCPQCGGQRVTMGCTRDTQLMREGKYMSSSVCGLKALVCLACGYTMLYAADLPRIQEEVRKHPGNFTY